MKRFVQIASGVSPGDAITNEIEILYRYALQSGLRAIVLAEHIGSGLSFPVDQPDYFTPDEGDVILFHYSISSRTIEKIIAWPVKLAIKYHNITPASYFEPYNLIIAGRLKRGRNELKNILPYFHLHIADSRFNARELESFIGDKVYVSPVLFPVRTMHRKARSICRNILFVGRVVPNKGIADLIKIFYFMQRQSEHLLLTICGGIFPGMELYFEELINLIQALGISQKVRFTGYVSEEELNAEYEKADLFISASYHEGFCVPVLEAMQAGLPVLAYVSEESAMKDTTGDAAVLFHKMHHETVAEMAVIMLEDTSLREILIQKGLARFRSFHQQNVLENLFFMLQSIT